MTSQVKSVSSVRADVVDFMKEQVYRGDFDRPRLKLDAAGYYHYKDDKLRIALAISPRDGWLNCSVIVHVLRRRLLLRKAELVLSTGYAYDVSVFRPGLWCDYIAGLAEEARAAQLERERRRQSQPDEAGASPESSFSPIDDSSIFGK